MQRFISVIEISTSVEDMGLAQAISYVLFRIQSWSRVQNSMANKSKLGQPSPRVWLCRRLRSRAISNRFGDCTSGFYQSRKYAEIVHRCSTSLYEAAAAAYRRKDPTANEQVSENSFSVIAEQFGKHIPGIMLQSIGMFVLSIQ